MPLTLEPAIARVPQRRDAREIKTTPLGGDITNKNYRGDVGGESFVLRIGGENTEFLGIDRQRERAASEAAARLGIGPAVVYFVEPEGYLVTRFIEGRPLPRDEMRKPENTRRVAAALKCFHAVPGIPGAFSPFRTVEEYASTARRSGVAFPALLKKDYASRSVHREECMTLRMELARLAEQNIAASRPQGERPPEA